MQRESQKYALKSRREETKEIDTQNRFDDISVTAKAGEMQHGTIVHRTYFRLPLHAGYDVVRGHRFRTGQVPWRCCILPAC